MRRAVVLFGIDVIFHSRVRAPARMGGLTDNLSTQLRFKRCAYFKRTREWERWFRSDRLIHGLLRWPIRKHERSSLDENQQHSGHRKCARIRPGLMKLNWHKVSSRHCHSNAAITLRKIIGAVNAEYAAAAATAAAAPGHD